MLSGRYGSKAIFFFYFLVFIMLTNTLPTHILISSSIPATLLDLDEIARENLFVCGHEMKVHKEEQTGVLTDECTTRCHGELP